MFGYYPTFHTLTSVGRKSTFSMLKICFRFSLPFKRISLCGETIFEYFVSYFLLFNSILNHMAFDFLLG